MSTAYNTPAADGSSRNAASRLHGGLPPQYAYDVDTQARIHPGDRIMSDKGEVWTYTGVGRPAYGNSSGRVNVSRPCPDAYDNGNGGRECVHLGHYDGMEQREYFPSVFDLYLGDAEGNEA